MREITRVIIADAHRVFVEEVKEVFSAMASVTVADEAADLDELLAKLSGNDYDLLLLDVSLACNRANSIPLIKGISPGLPVLVLSLYDDEHYAVHALNSGAAGYLRKGAPPDELVKAVQATAQGEGYLCPSMAALLPSVHGADRGSRHQRLSKREYRVMLLLAAGLTTKAIAEELMVGVKTVESYCLLILQKMEVQSVGELSRYLADRPD